MSFPTTPAMVAKEDSRKFSSRAEDPAIRSRVEGGYVITRPRYTKKPSAVYTTGFTFITDAEKIKLENLWDETMGGSNSFNWTNPQTGAVIEVRFTKEIGFKFVGIQSDHRWDIDIELREV